MHMAACCEERTRELGLGSELPIYSAANRTPLNARKIDASSPCDLIVWWMRKKMCDESLPVADPAGTKRLPSCNSSRQSEKSPESRLSLLYTF